MKKSIVILIFATLCLCSVFSANQVRTSFIPYSFQRFDSSSGTEPTFDSNYGWGLKVDYLYSNRKGITFGGELGSFNYRLPREAEVLKLNDGLCVVCPAFVKFGYLTPLEKEKFIRYFIFAEVGVRLLCARFEANANPLFGIDTGFALSIGRNLNLSFALEPALAYSEQDKDNIKRTDFSINANIGLGYEF